MSVSALPECLYVDDLVRMYAADCHDIALLAHEADTAIVDPPYGDTSLEWDRITDDWLGVVAGAVKDNGWLVLWTSMRHLLAVANSIEERGWHYSQDIVWEKHNGSSSAADRFRRVHEHAVLFYRGDWTGTYHDPQFSLDATPRAVRRKQRPAHWGEIGEHSYKSVDGGPRHMRSVMYERSSHGEAIHPTQKPLGILRTLIQYTTPPGGLVIDPYAGSASTLLAARMCGRQAIGTDNHRPYVEAAAERLNVLQLPIGAVNG